MQYNLKVYFSLPFFKLSPLGVRGEGEAKRHSEMQIKINNIDTRLKEKIIAVNSMGLSNTVNQYEMEFVF